MIQAKLEDVQAGLAADLMHEGSGAADLTERKDSSALGPSGGQTRVARPLAPDDLPAADSKSGSTLQFILRCSSTNSVGVAQNA